MFYVLFLRVLQVNNKICSHHGIAEILQKLALNTNQSINNLTDVQSCIFHHNFLFHSLSMKISTNTLSSALRGIQENVKLN